MYRVPANIVTLIVAMSYYCLEMNLTTSLGPFSFSFISACSSSQAGVLANKLEIIGLERN